MSRHRFFVEVPLVRTSDAQRLGLSRSDLHHAIDVLRIRAGEEIVAVEPDGSAWIVGIVAARGDTLEGRLVGALPLVAATRITLFQGVAKGQTMDAIVQHAVELGVERIVPVITERTVVRLDGAKAEARSVRWQRIAQNAAAQSQRSRVPTVDEPRALPDVTSTLEGYDLAVVLWEESDAPGLSHVFAEAIPGCAVDDPSVALVVGPEGGLTTGEVELLKSSGARVASLGPAILRAETAALAAITLVADFLGGLGGGRP